MDVTDEPTNEPQEVIEDVPTTGIFVPPSVLQEQILFGESYTYVSAVPPAVLENKAIECVLGVDEAGRGPVLGPMVYALAYLPLSLHHSLLAQTHHFDDSKVLTASARSSLMSTICDPSSDLFHSCGWATRSLSARDISSAQLRPSGPYNLNAQAMDATIALIQGILDLGVNVREIYIDTIGPPATYQRKLELIFPSISITVAKKADSLYPCVSAASVCAKVTRDASLEVLHSAYAAGDAAQGEAMTMAWGSGYPSDARCTNWMKSNMHPLFGWGNECRYSWGTAKEMLEVKKGGTAATCQVDWPEMENGEGGENLKISGFLMGPEEEDVDEMVGWYGKRVTAEVF